MGHKRFERCFKVLSAMVCHIRIHRCARVHNGRVEFEEAILQCLKLNSRSHIEFGKGVKKKSVLNSWFYFSLSGFYVSLA